MCEPYEIAFSDPDAFDSVLPAAEIDSSGVAVQPKTYSTNNTVCGFIEAVRSAAGCGCHVRCADMWQNKEQSVDGILPFLRLLPASVCGAVFLITAGIVAYDYLRFYAQNNAHRRHGAEYYDLSREDDHESAFVKGILKTKRIDHLAEAPTETQESINYGSKARVSFATQPTTIIPSLRKAVSEDLTNRQNNSHNFRRQSQRIRPRSRKQNKGNHED
ncbi:uncharacterized protein LOC129584823 isoform X2 [Paramacrobiotus metropolitanus]|uniref:uncharacterized protein LOC129584823 isoform X2 n=1 Tax=Paramacrobiotus metropolitanus TaxID=2943436 RepID=UPI00244569B7|nr:uncharacterized protein LOC129584823 isoform X2 [Paramacrobiotus metropolitanus]